MRKPLLALILLRSQHSYRMAGWGRAFEWEEVCTPAMCGCWWLFLYASFSPILLMYIFSSCLQDTVTHISIWARDSARGLWGGRAQGWRWPNFSRLMYNASFLFSYFKIYEPHLSLKEQRQIIFQECFHFTNSEVSRNNFFKMHVNTRCIELLKCS